MGRSLFEVLDTIEIPPRDPKEPVRMPIIDKYKAVVMGKIESGTIQENDNLLLMPNKAHLKMLAIYCDENKSRRAVPGENVRVKVWRRRRRHIGWLCTFKCRVSRAT